METEKQLTKTPQAYKLNITKNEINKILVSLEEDQDILYYEEHQSKMLKGETKRELMISLLKQIETKKEEVEIPEDAD